MSLKSYIVPRVVERVLGENQLSKKRAKFEAKRAAKGEPHKVEFFHDPSDPYSQLLEKALPDFAQKYDIELITHLVGPPDDLNAPEREKLAAYARMDAMRLAKKAGIDFTIQDHAPAADTSAADARREALGHYLGGMLYYGEEWYWGLDRLHYLEARLAELGARHDAVTDFIYTPPVMPVSTGKTQTGKTQAELHCYLSFRSPYSAIVRDRAKAMADAYGADLKLRFVLPMVMRNLPVPPAKKTYIPFDTAREARRLNVPFGRVCDPIGKPVEMAYALMAWARKQGLDYAYTQSWLSGVWSEGIDAGSQKGLKKIVERAGLNWQEAKGMIDSEDWREEEKANRAEMMEYGIWGVPSFRVGDTITWGQDRLWVTEHALQKLVKP